MGVRILHDSEHDQAVLYCSTTDWAFGPVFQAGDDGDHDAAERAEAFVRWLAMPAPKWTTYEKESAVFASRYDARELTAAGLEAAYADWRDQEATQYQRERLTYLTKHMLRGIDEALWQQVKHKAAAEGHPLRWLFLQWLKAYVQPAATNAVDPSAQHRER